jgi:hypothetical protein
MSMHVWRYDLGSWIEDDVPLAVGREFPQGFEHPPFMTLGDVTPQARGVSAAVHESTDGGRLSGHSLWGRRSVRPRAGGYLEARPFARSHHQFAELGDEIEREDRGTMTMSFETLTNHSVPPRCGCYVEHERS